MALPLIVNNPRPIIISLLGILQLITLYIVAILTEEKLYIWLLVPLAIEIAIIVSPFYFIPKFLRWRDIEAVGTFLRMMRDIAVSNTPKDDIRCSIFRPSLFKRRLIEAVICTKDGLEKRKNKYMNVSQGVAGRAYRLRQTTYVPIIGDWKSQLMDNFGFSEREVNRFKSDRKSYLSIPILKRGEEQEVEAVAVVSFDSTSDGTFTDDVIVKIEWVAAYIVNII